jgi:hypothetical protein
VGQGPVAQALVADVTPKVPQQSCGDVQSDADSQAKATVPPSTATTGTPVAPPLEPLELLL